MKYFLFVLFFISLGFSPQNPYLLNDAEYTYILPEGFEIINTLEENGVLSAVDEHGNGVDIYVDNVDIDINAQIRLLKEEWKDLMVGEKVLSDGGYIMRISTEDVIYPVDTIVVIRQQGFWVKAVFLKLGDSQTHSVFEEEAVTLLRSIAQGARHEKVWVHCIRTVVGAFDRLGGESISIGFPAV